MQLPIFLPQLWGLQSAAAHRYDMHMGSTTCCCPSLCRNPGGVAAKHGVIMVQLKTVVAGSAMVPLDWLQMQTVQLTTNKSSAGGRMTCSCSALRLSR